MAHVGQELALGPVGRLGRLLGPCSSSLERRSSAAVRSSSPTRAAALRPPPFRPGRAAFPAPCSSALRGCAGSLPGRTCAGAGRGCGPSGPPCRWICPRSRRPRLPGPGSGLPCSPAPVSIRTAIGLSIVRRSSLIRRHTSMPFMSGITRSTRTQSNGSRASRSSPSLPLAARSTW